MSQEFHRRGRGAALLALALALLPGSGTLFALPPDRLPVRTGLPETLPSSAGASGLLPFAPPAGVSLDRRSLQGYSSTDLGDRAFVLCWHTFIGDTPYQTDLSLAQFGAELDALRALGYRFLTAEELVAGAFRGRMNVVITIDDGHRTVPEAVRKVLEPRGIVATLFAYPAVLGTTTFAMSDRELASLVLEGAEVGAHGYHHLRVVETLYRREPAVFAEEIYKSKFKTEALSGHSVLLYAYPFGAYCPQAKEELRKAGFAAAFTADPGWVYANPALNDPFALPRIVVRRDNWKEILALLGRNAAGEGVFAPAAAGR